MLIQKKGWKKQQLDLNSNRVSLALFATIMTIMVDDDRPNLFALVTRQILGERTKYHEASLSRPGKVLGIRILQRESTKHGRDIGSRRHAHSFAQRHAYISINSTELV